MDLLRNLPQEEGLSNSSLPCVRGGAAVVLRRRGCSPFIQISPKPSKNSQKSPSPLQNRDEGQNPPRCHPYRFKKSSQRYLYILRL